MADIVDKKTRSRMMSAVPRRFTRPENAVYQLLRSAGIKARRNPRTRLGSPDLSIPQEKVVIFVHGCFWHAHSKCRFATVPRSNESYWRPKLLRNAERDARISRDWRKAGWRVVVVWTCALRKVDGAMGLGNRLLSAVKGTRGHSELSWRRRRVAARSRSPLKRSR